MKPRTSSSHENGNGSFHDLAARAATTEKIAQVARKHYKMLKAEYKLARKAFRQAKKAARCARKEAKVAEQLLKSKSGVRTSARKVKAVRSSARKSRLHTSRARQSHQPIAMPAPVPATVAIASV
jgi:hypothetical protein